MAIGYCYTGHQLKITRTSNFITPMAGHVIVTKNVWAARLELTILTVAHLDQKAMQPANHTELTDGALQFADIQIVKKKRTKTQ